jgi:hypothetical protein
MAWKVAQRRRGGGTSEKSELAAEILASLLGAQKKGGGATDRGPQWRCGECGGCSNDTSRAKCRNCGATKGGRAGRGAKSGVVPPGVEPVPPRAWPRPPTPEERAANSADKAAALRAAAEVLRAAGFEDEAAVLDKPAADLVKLGAAEKPGSRLDACASFVTRAEKRVEGATVVLVAAELALEDARAQQVRLKEELAEGKRRLEELRADLSATTPAVSAAPLAEGPLVGDVKALLAVLESGSWAAAASLPESMLDAMRRLHAAVEVVAPLPPPRLDAALEPRAAVDAAAHHVPDTSSEGFGDDEDAVMGELDAAETDEALADIARRLKRARRQR